MSQFDQGNVMKIAISAAGTDLESNVEPRFGRCPYFIVVNPETMEFEALENSAAMAAGGAGISAAQSIADKGVQLVLTGHCGPNAYQTLSAAGIRVISGVSGKVKDVLDAFRSGKLKVSSQADVPDHFGLGNKSLQCHAGNGVGREMGTGCRKARMMESGSSSEDRDSLKPLSYEQELQNLKAQAQAILSQLVDIQQRIEKLEKK